MKNLYVHLPLKDSNNSFYFHLTQVQAGGTSDGASLAVSASLDRLDVFAAKNFDQPNRYCCLVLEGVHFALEQCFNGSGLSVLAGCKGIYITTNENFVILLANTVEHSFPHV
jgi:hypothetical protein